MLVKPMRLVAALAAFGLLGASCGDEGRSALIRGEDRVTDQEYVDTFVAMARLGPYMHPGASGIPYPDGRVLFKTGQLRHPNRTSLY